MFITISEIGPTLYNVKVMDNCCNVYEDIDTDNPEKITKNLKEMYQCDERR